MIGNALKRIVRRIPLLRRTVGRIRGMRLHDPNIRRRVTVLGSGYGGWGVDLAWLDQQSIVYSVGVGEDITFDEALIAHLNCEVLAFDPTPISLDWLKGHSAPAGFRLYPVGLSAVDDKIALSMPIAKDGVSFSHYSGQATASTEGIVFCPGKRLATLMSDFGHARVDLLKMDIEGAEYEVVADIIKSGIRPGQMLIEFHHGLYNIERRATREAVRMLKLYGYGLFWVSDRGSEYGFCDLRDDARRALT